LLVHRDMEKIMRKILWIVDGDKEGLLDRANYIRAQAVCVRTTNAWLKSSIQGIKGHGLDVYAWRWPSVDPTSNVNHHYADDEAKFVQDLIAEGLDGYIVDPESDDRRASDDWNDPSLADLANRFCDAIKLKGRQRNPRFLFGTTSGCDYPVLKPQIPWSIFLAHSDAVYPQIYWAPNYIRAKRTTPDAAWNIGMAAWNKIISARMPVHPILGEITVNKPSEIARFSQIMIEQKNAGEVHFYAYDDDMLDAKWKDTWDALRDVGSTSVALPSQVTTSEVTNLRTTGARLLEIAKQHIGEPYDHKPVPKNRPDWRGPWDCSEFMSWVVYQAAGVLYGCTNDHDDPAVAHGFTGAWGDDSLRLGIRIPWERASGIAGAMVLRLPPAPNVMGHIAICDGHGGTVEAKGREFGVVADQVGGRRWDTGVLIPGVAYDDSAPVDVTPPALVYYVGAANLDPSIVRKIQTKLFERGFNPVQIDGDYGVNTAIAVAAFQFFHGLVSDGEVGPDTAAALNISLV
jgi:hypothetical protein